GMPGIVTRSAAKAISSPPTRLRLGRKSRAKLFAGHRIIDGVTTDILAAGLNDQSITTGSRLLIPLA
ncbi:MAG: hypothetical protein VX085_16700, partial [Pseudomonadota bacterium]|nr:hypothetical protein [Pseudomonadota bacterium]